MDLMDKLTPAEERLKQAVAQGIVADYRVFNADVDNPVNGGTWDTRRTLRAEIIRQLCLHEEHDGTHGPRGVRLIGARIVNTLDFEGAELTTPLYLNACFIEKPANLQNARVQTVCLDGSLVTGIQANGLVTHGSLLLSKGFTARGEVQLSFARIEGLLDCNGAQFTNLSGVALNLDGLTAKSLFLSHGFRAVGVVNLRSAKIGTDLNCQGATFKNPGSIALSAEGLVVGGSVLLQAYIDMGGKLSEPFLAQGEVRLKGAEIGASLDCSRALFDNPKGIALDATELIAKAVYLRHGFRARGTVRLVSARIGDYLDCQGATFENPNGTALLANHVTIGASVLCRGYVDDDGILLERLTVRGIVRLHGAKIGGDLDCQGATFENPGGIVLNAESAEVRGSVFLRTRVIDSSQALDGFTARGIVRLYGAKIGGNLDCQGATLENLGGIVLNAESAEIGGSVLLRTFLGGSGQWLGSFTARGTVLFYRAKIGGNLDCQGAILENPNGMALLAEGVEVGGAVFLRTRVADYDQRWDRCTVRGIVRLRGAKIGGDLDCQGATVENPGDIALNAESAEIGGSALLRTFLGDSGQWPGSFTARGTVLFYRAKIGGDLDCRGATLENPRGIVLNAESIEIGGSVFLRTQLTDGGQRLEPFIAKGMVDLRGAKIGASLECDGATFENPNDIALHAERIVVGSVLLRTRGGMSTRCRAKGTVRLFLAEIGGNLECQGALFERPGGYALEAYGLAVKGDFRLCNGFRASGLVNLEGARIGAVLDCSGASFGEMPVGGSPSTQQADSTPSGGAIQDGLRLDNAQVTRFVDDEASWPSEGKLSINGFVYGTFGNDSLADAKMRLRWLDRQPKAFRPQPYEQLIRVLRQIGRDADARKVAIAKQDVLRRRGQLSRLGRMGNWLLGLTIGHGYKPWKALLIMLIFLISGAVIFSYASDHGAMKPPKAEASLSPDSRHCDAKYPCFTPLLYSLDTLLPIIDLRQKMFWLPDASTRIGMVCRSYLWLHIFMGYILTTLAVVGLTGLVKKE